MANSKKVEFDFNGQTKVAYWNGKEYGAGRTVYFSSVRKGGTSETKGAFSIADEEFKNFKAGELAEVKAAARALGFIQ